MNLEIKKISELSEYINNLVPNIIILCADHFEKESIRKQIETKYISKYVDIKCYLQDPSTGAGYDLFFISRLIVESQELYSWLAMAKRNAKLFYLD